MDCYSWQEEKAHYFQNPPSADSKKELPVSTSRWYTAGSKIISR